MYGNLIKKVERVSTFKRLDGARALINIPMGKVD